MKLAEIVALAKINLPKAKKKLKDVKFESFDECLDLLKILVINRIPEDRWLFFRQLTRRFPGKIIDLRRLMRFLVTHPQAFEVILELSVKIPRNQLPPEGDILLLSRPFSDEEIEKRKNERKPVSLTDETQPLVSFLALVKEKKLSRRWRYYSSEKRFILAHKKISELRR